MSQLATPTITAEIIDRVKIRISGLSVANASAYQLRWGTLSGGGRVDTVQPDSEGSFLLDDCRARTTYFIAARALGDDENYENSSWSDEVMIVTGQVVDPSIAVPSATVGIPGFTCVELNGLLLDRSYRYQVSTDPDNLADQPPRITGAGTGTSGGGRIMGLEPGNTYYIRICSTAPHGRCSLWSDVQSFTLPSLTSEIVVENTNDSGAGSLRQAIADSSNYTLITFDPSLNGKTITLASSLSSSVTLVIDATSLPDGITLDFNNVANNYVRMQPTHWRGITFKNLVVTNSNTQGFIGGFFTGCTFENMQQAANYAILNNASLYRCRLIGCSSGTSGSTLSNCWVGETLIDGCSGGLLYQCAAANVVFVGCYMRYALSGCRSSNCVIYGNSSNAASMAVNGGTAYECDVVGNQIEFTAVPNTGQVCTGTLYDCRVENNRSNGNYAPAFNTGYLYDCVFKDNTGKLGNGVGNGYFYRCKIIETDRTRQMTNGNSMYFTDCLLMGGNVTGGVHNNNTVLKMTGAGSAVNNCLLGPGSIDPSSASHVLHWDDTPTSPLYAGKVFLDAANGDYRLCIDSPAIGAGSTGYVSEGDLDLSGNPRITNGKVSCGAYEFAAFELEPPTYSLQFASGGQGTVAFTLPQYSDSFCLQYSSDAGFTDPGSISSASSGFALSGLSGDVWFRAKSVGVSGVSLDSAWTEPRHVYVDAEAPIVVVNEEPIEMVVGQTVDLLDGVAVDDDSSGAPQLHYQVIGRDNEPVSVDGRTIDPRTSGIPKGNYKLVITAADAVGNVGTSDRGLVVLPPRLPAPSLTLRSVSGTTVVLAGLTNLFASGWQLDHNGTVSTITPDAAGYFVIEQLSENVTHVFKARALGDYAQPQPPAVMSGDHRDSDWSDAVSVTILPPQPPVGAFWQWRTEPLMSHDGRIRQNVALRARIFDARSGELLPPTVVTGAEFTCWRLNADGTRTAVTGFNAVAVPNSAFSAAADDDGFNFTYIPDQTSTRMFAAAGRYVLVVAVQLASGNPFDIYSNELTVF